MADSRFMYNRLNDVESYQSTRVQSGTKKWRASTAWIHARKLYIRQTRCRCSIVNGSCEIMILISSILAHLLLCSPLRRIVTSHSVGFIEHKNHAAFFVTSAFTRCAGAEITSLLSSSAALSGSSHMNPIATMMVHQTALGTCTFPHLLCHNHAMLNHRYHMHLWQAANNVQIHVLD